MSVVPIMFSIAFVVAIFATFVRVEIEMRPWAKVFYSFVFWVVVAWLLL